MSAFATASDLATRLGVTLSSGEQTRATSLLNDASDLIRQEVKQDISLVQDDVLTIRGVHDRELKLPQRPLVSVASITYRDTADPADVAHTLDPENYYIDGGSLIRYRSLGLLNFQGATGNDWFGPMYELVITYTHGHETVPTQVKTIAVEAVRRVWVNPGSLVSEMHGSEQYAYTGGDVPGGLALTADEVKSLKKAFGLHGLGSVGLR